MSHTTSLRAKYRARQLELLTLEERLTPAYDISLIDINTVNGQAVGSSSPEWITPLGNIVIFSADNGTNGRELWRSDGTTAGTYMIKDIYEGSTGSIPRDLTPANGLVYFTASNGTNGRELWKTDGTAGGTVMVADIAPGALHAFSIDPETRLVENSTQTGPLAWITNVNGTVFFVANDNKSGFELWKTDGTAQNTVQVKNISADSGSTIGSSTPLWLCNVNNTLYFTADTYDPTGQTTGTGRELWKSDGTANGTAIVRDITPGSTGSNPSNLYAFNNKLYFTVFWAAPSSGSLWVSEGTALTTSPVADITGTSSLESNGSPFIGLDQNLFLSAYTNSFGSELYKSDGTNAGTSIISDYVPGTFNGARLDFLYDNLKIPDIIGANAISFNGKLYYSNGGSGILNSDLISTDGTFLGTKTLKAFAGDYARIIFGTVLGDTVLYSVTGGLDGTYNNGRINSVHGLNTTTNTDSVIGLESFFSNFTTRMQAAGGKAFFGATEGSVGTELWVVREVNAPPVVSTGLAGRTTSAGSPVSFSVASSFSDPNNDTLSFTAMGLPAGLSISSAGLISGTIASTAATGSPYTTRVTANDGNGGTVTASFTWTVLAPNRNPVAGTLSARTSGISDIVSLSVASSFSDPDNDPLSFSATNLPPGLAMSATGLVSGTVLSSASTSTPYAVTVTVTDGRGGTATGSFSWTINAANRPPVASNLADRSDSTGNRVSFAAASAFSDPDFDSLSFTATGLPDGLAVSASGIVTGTIASTASASSPYTTRITASDGRGGTVTASFIWTVTAGASIPRNAAFDLIGLSDMRANPATAGIDGTGIGVAVIDTGIDYAHALFQSGGNTAYYTAEDISGGLVPVGRDFTGDAAEGSFRPGDSRNRYSSSRFNSPSVNQRNAAFVSAGGGLDNQPEDTNGHGTHVAGIIGARNPDIGVATGSKLIGLKVLGTDGLGSNENVLAALEWVRANAAYYNIKVVNMSLGYGFFSSLGEGDPFASTIADLEAQGITIVSAAGNLYGLTPTERNSATPGIASTLTVGAVWKDGTVNQAYWPEGDTYDYTTGAGRLTSFSQRPADIVDNGIFAPGALMLSAIPNNGVDPTRGNDLTAELAGTSQAAPVVSGVVALMQDAAYRAGGRYLTPAEIRQILFQTATTVNDGDNEDDGFARDPDTLQYTL
ncbi:MAG: ELWxxDGT repeat protein, partial [Gemmataceae bacterium]